MGKDSRRDIKGLTKGSELYSKSLVASEAMRKSIEKGIHWRLVGYKGDGPDAKPYFGTEAVKAVFDVLDVIGAPGEQPRVVDRVLNSHNKTAFKIGGEGEDTGKDAFGGAHNGAYQDLELIEGRHYLRAIDEVKVKEGDLEKIVDKQGMFDIDGNLLSGKIYDSIERYVPSPDIAKEVGDVLLVREGNKQGIMRPNGSFIGEMQVVFESDELWSKPTGRINLKRFGKEICLYVQKGHEIKKKNPNNGEEEKEFVAEEEMYVSQNGRVLYGGWCVKLEEFKLGKRVLGLAKDNKEKGKGQLHTRNGKKLYGGKHIKFHPRMFPYGKRQILLQAYDEEGLIILDRNGNNHHGPYHYDPKEKGVEIECTDGEDLARFLDEEKRDNVVRYWGFDNRIAFGGSHEKELQAGEEIDVPFTIKIGNQFITAKKFADKQGIGYFAKDPINDGSCELFGGYHLTQKQFMPWAGEPYYVFQDNQGDAVFHWTGQIVGGGYHPHGSIKKKLKQIDKQVGDKLERFAFLEVAEPVSLWRWLWNGVFGLRYLFTWSRPSNLYGFYKGEEFKSVRDAQRRYQIPEDTKLKPVTDSAANWPVIKDVEEAKAILERGRFKVHPDIQKELDAKRAEMEKDKDK